MAKVILMGSLAAACVFAAALPARAQCVTFSPTASCVAPQTSPLRTVDFGVSQPTPPPTRYKVVPFVPTPSTTSARDANAPDCKMAKPVDPSFTSAMPVGRPDANLRFSGKILPVPACRP